MSTLPIIRQLKNEVEELRASNETKHRQIQHLKAALDTARDLGSFTTFRNTVAGRRTMTVAPTDMDISKTIFDLKGSIRQAFITMTFGSNRVSSSTLACLKSHHPDVLDHLRLFFGQRLGSCSETSRSQLAGQHDPQQILCASLCVSMLDWIFYADVFAISEAEVSLYKAQSQCVYNQGNAVKTSLKH